MLKLLLVNNQVKQNVIKKFTDAKKDNVDLLEYDSNVQNTPELFIEFLRTNLSGKKYETIGFCGLNGRHTFHGYMGEQNPVELLIRCRPVGESKLWPVTCYSRGVVVGTDINPCVRGCDSRCRLDT